MIYQIIFLFIFTLLFTWGLGYLLAELQYRDAKKQIRKDLWEKNKHKWIKKINTIRYEEI